MGPVIIRNSWAWRTGLAGARWHAELFSSIIKEPIIPGDEMELLARGRGDRCALMLIVI